MLSMLMMTPPKTRGTLSKQWRKIFPPPISAFLDTVDNFPYIKILCEEHSRGIDWRMIAAHSLECSDRLLMPSEMTCPPESELRRFTPTRFLRRMMENLALDILISSDTPPSKRSIALYGNEAELAQFLPRLIHLAGEVRIISRRGYAIKDIADELIKKTGMSITVTDIPDIGRCDILLAPFGGAGFIKAHADAIIIAPDRPSGECAAWINSIGISIPSVLEEAYDTQFDILEFVGAFYELAGMYELARLSPDYGSCGNGRITASELASLISHQ